MKAPYSTTISVFFGLLATLTAQNFDKQLGHTSVSSLPVGEQLAAPLTPGDIPADSRIKASVAEAPAAYSAQDSITLEPRTGKHQAVDSVINLDVLQKPSPYHAVAKGSQDATSEVVTDEVKQELALISATYRVSGARETNCENISLSVEQRIKLNGSDVLEIVDAEVRSNPSCSCEIVKSAIMAVDADTDLVVAIVETVIIASPESMSIASQCAIAAVPESLASIQALLSKYDSNAGESGYSSKSAKSAKVGAVEMPDSVAAMPNPLDFPGAGPVGPAPGGQPVIRPIIPIVVVTPVTRVSP